MHLIFNIFAGSRSAFDTLNCTHLKHMEYSPNVYIKIAETDLTEEDYSKFVFLTDNVYNGAEPFTQFNIFDYYNNFPEATEMIYKAFEDYQGETKTCSSYEEAVSLLGQLLANREKYEKYDIVLMVKVDTVALHWTNTLYTEVLSNNDEDFPVIFYCKLHL